MSGVVAPDPDASGSLPYPAVRYTYNADGNITQVESGTVVSQAYGDFANFIGQRSVATTYDSVGRKNSDDYAGNNAGGTYFDTAFVQYGYDKANNPQCVATRMNHAHFGSAATSACTQETPGASPPDSMADMITAYAYDPGDRLTTITKSSGTYSSPSSIAYETLTYTVNGDLNSLVDANNNLTRYTYDGYDRLAHKYYPSATLGAGAYDPNDFEAYAYDNNGNLTSRRLRGLSPAQNINFTYDALNRVTRKAFPAGTNGNVVYSWDLLNRLLSATYESGGAGVAYTYDALGRALTSTASGQALQYQYDHAGNRTSITWPDTGANALTVQYDHDMLGRVTEIDANPPSSGATILAKYTYDAFGNRTKINRAGGPGVVTSVAYDNADRIRTLTHNFAATTDDVTLSPTYSYNPSPQKVGQGVSNDEYTDQASALNRSFVANGLNQYATVGGASYAHDQHGNLTNAVNNSYTYDLENRLLTMAGPSQSVALTYDPLGRLQTSTSSGATTRYLFDGDDLVEVNDSAGATTSRYVPGPGIDEPLVLYQGATLTAPRWLVADTQGSIISYADASGASLDTHTYDPSGGPSAWMGSRLYSYTGQLQIPVAGLYYYKARMYNPAIGRFMQTDPIGYDADVNLYTYANNDPINGSDPSGLATCASNDKACIAAALAEVTTVREFVVTASHGPVGMAPNFFVYRIQGASGGPGGDERNGGWPQNTQPNCNTVLPNGQTIGDAGIR